MSTLDLDKVKRRLARANWWAMLELNRKGVVALLAELASDYLSAAPERRAAIRALFDRTGRLVELLPSAGAVLSSAVKAPADVEKIRVALAMVSMCDMRTDEREIQLSLLEILRIAQRSGIDPAPLVKDVAAISNTKGGEYSAKAFLEKFV